MSASSSTMAPGLTGATYAPPANAIVIAAGANIQATVDSHPAGTAFLLSAGTYSGQTISPKDGDSFFGQNGQAVLDGGGAQHAFQGQGVSNVTISGLQITNYAPPSSGIGALGTDNGSVGWTVQGCRFYGIKTGVPIMLGTNMTVQNCSIYNNENSGIEAYDVTGGTVQNNAIYNNNTTQQSPFTATGDNAGIKISLCSNVHIVNNNIYNNASAPGIWTDDGCSGTLINGNSIHNNGVTGIIDEIDYGATISNNTITGNNNPSFGGFEGGGIYLQNAANANVYGNTITGNDGGVWIYDSNRGSGAQGTYAVQNDSIHNNTIQMSAGQNGYDGSVGTGAVSWADNSYNLTGSSQLVVAGQQVSVAQWQANGYDTTASGSTFGSAAPSGGGSSSVSSGTGGSTSGGSTSGSSNPGGSTSGSGTTVSPAPAPVPSPPAAPSTDTISVTVSGDQWKGAPKFIMLANGKQIGPTETATAIHRTGATQVITVTGDFGTVDQLGIRFINDAYAGTPSTDRNLYVEDVKVNGGNWGHAAYSDPAGYVSSKETVLLSNGTAHFRSVL